jgi:hypothetical protein
MESLSWISHPAKRRKTATIVVTIFLMVVFVMVYIITQSKVMTLLAMLLFTMSLSTYYFPTRYEISREKVKIKYLFTAVEKEITSFRSFYPDKNGVLLSPFLGPSRLENFRGLYLRYHKNKTEVDEFVKKIFEERPSGN